jgi:hypothetical protein
LEWKPPYAAWYLGGTLNACYKPGVRRIRDAAELTGDNVWITVTVPGDFQGAQGDPAPGAEAIRQWTSVVLHAVELTWLREMLALNSAGEETCG